MDKKSFLFQEELQLNGGAITSMSNSAEQLYALTAKGALVNV